MADKTITEAERQDVIAVGASVRRMEIEARRLRADADRIAAAGNPAMAGVYLTAAEGADRQVRQIKELWQNAEGFAEGYTT